MATSFHCSDCQEARAPEIDAGGCCPVCGGILETRTAPNTQPTAIQRPAALPAGTNLDVLAPLLEHLPGLEGIMAMATRAQEELAAGAGGMLEPPGQPGAGRTAGASPEALAALYRHTIGPNSWILHQTSLSVSTGHSGADGTAPPTDASAAGATAVSPAAAAAVHLDAVFADFSPPPSTVVAGPLALVEPLSCHPAIANAAALAGCVAVVDRGTITFASKALKAQAAGAAAVVVMQTADVWPYVMKDTAGEAAVGALRIPVCMVSRAVGARLKALLQQARKSPPPPPFPPGGGGSSAVATNLAVAAAAGRRHWCALSVQASERECVVCQDLLAEGAQIVRLPCGHLFHESCVMPAPVDRSSTLTCLQKLSSAYVSSPFLQMR
ncbi:unnamed protein product, partial [Phaeothamnion confervicola]